MAKIEFINTVASEMAKGNFSFAILVVGTLQLMVMCVTLINNNKKK